MKTLLHHFILILLLGLVAFSSAQLQAGEAQLTQVIADNDSNYSGGFLRLGYGYKARINPYEDEEKGETFFVKGRYQWQLGFFVEAAYYRVLNEGLRVGYNFYNTERWNLDIHNVVAHGDLDIKIDYFERYFTMQRNETQMLALRATGSFQQTTLQFVFAPYSFNDETDGIYASAALDRSFQLKNWQVYASLGVEYRSKKLLEYYYAIARTGSWTEIYFPSYQPGDGIDVTGEIGVSYPISKNWLFEAYHKYTNLADSIDDSPLFQYNSTRYGRSKNVSETGLLISYTF
ncbi:MipA/OmpV family protein [Thalassomonas haliotis]|uniref:MipA/OmpV family protein n=1 Tax=Thalassomonas haliotis TaxID=485448 RepID=A0ABY7VDZ2_9GAMM|nr:MipA/OmpV family protein [Thalassomonas haliotis]WDE11898.1 MipA/OmpV family protein [Thalassomonas haliotis]